MRVRGQSRISVARAVTPADDNARSPVMVAVTASLLLSPLLWDHYLALLVLPAAFLAQRWAPLALALPMLSWLPAVLHPVLVVVALGLLLLAPPPPLPDKYDLRAGPGQASRPAFA